MKPTAPSSHRTHVSQATGTSDGAPSGAGAVVLSRSTLVVTLSDPVTAFLAIVAAHDRVTAEAFITRAICARMEEIGLSTALDMIGRAEEERGDG